MREVKLPEPAAFTTQIKEGRVIFMARVSLNTQGLVGIFTSDQLRQAVQEAVEAERENRDARNRGLLQAAKQAVSALRKWRMATHGPVANAGLIYEAVGCLEPAIEREEDFLEAVAAAIRGTTSQPAKEKT
jgi:hypothetical protein